MIRELVGALILGSIYSLFALGLSLVWGVGNVLNLAHGAIFMFSAFAAYWITRSNALPLVVLLPFAAVVGGLLSVALEFAAFRPIRARVKDARQAELAMLLASIGAGAVLVGIAENATHLQVETLPAAVFRTRVYRVGSSVSITNVQILIVVLAVLLSVGLGIAVRSTRSGRALRAVAYDPLAASLMGVNANGMVAVTMFLSGAMAGAAGVMLVLELNAFLPDIGDPLLLKAFAVIILGGVGSVGGTLAGAYALALAETLAVAYGLGQVRDAIAFGFIVVVLLVRPQGLFGATAAERS